jgi:hypothetical protein
MKKLGLFIIALVLLILSFGSAISVGEDCYSRCARLYAGNPAAIRACQARCPR